MDRKILDLEIKKNKLDGMLITSSFNRTWFTSFISTAGYLFVEKNEATIFLDGRYITDAKAKINNATIKPLKTNEDFFNWIKNKGFKKIGIEADYLTVEIFELFRKNLPNVEFISINGSFLRSVKSKSEIEIIKKACKISLDSLKNIQHLIKPGISEIEIRNQLELECKKNGAQRQGFDSIVVSGIRSALPHGKPSNKLIEEGDLVTIDFGAEYNGFTADITRTFKIGKNIDPKLNEIYDIVEKAQELGIKAIKPGIKTVEIDKICRDYITSKGYGNYFNHGTGHGLGVEVHEKPINSQISKETLEVGNVVTVEPGIYIPNLGGVRIEDDILVTKKGFEILSR